MSTAYLIMLAFSTPLVSTHQPLRARINGRSSVRCNGIDVSDLGLSLTDLQKPLPAGLDAALSVTSMGIESTSGLPEKRDEGISWRESFDTIEATLVIPGLRGQPAAAMLVELAETTCTITVFGRIIWSGILRGEIDPRASMGYVKLDGMQPVIDVSMRKAYPEGDRWNGFLLSIGVDSVLQ
jgi:hypothetical protein